MWQFISKFMRWLIAWLRKLFNRQQKMQLTVKVLLLALFVLPVSGQELQYLRHYLDYTGETTVNGLGFHREVATDTINRTNLVTYDIMVVDTINPPIPWSEIDINENTLCWQEDSSVVKIAYNQTYYMRDQTFIGTRTSTWSKWVAIHFLFGDLSTNKGEDSKRINVIDFNIFSNRFGDIGASYRDWYDLNQDGRVDIVDFNIFSNRFGEMWNP